MLYAFFWVIPRRLILYSDVSEHSVPSSQAGNLPACEDVTECSETSAYKNQTPGNYPKESIQQIIKKCCGGEEWRTDCVKNQRRWRNTMRTVKKEEGYLD
jgi:hypothetical protein